MIRLAYYEYHRNRNPWAGHMDRWLGTEQAEGIARASRGFRHPIALANVPGCVWVYDGDYIGAIRGGGFASLSDLISEATTGGKKQVLCYNKAGVAAPAAGASQSLWAVGTVPAAGSNAAGPPGGTIPTNASTGALPIVNAAGGDTLHFISWTGAMSVAQTSALMLYDYLFGVNINLAAPTSEAVTGVPTRYQTAATAPGNFISGRVTTGLAATAHNIDFTYVDQDGNAAQTGSAQAVRVSSLVNTLPFTQPKWFYELTAPDTGARNITNINQSAASTGNIDWFIGHAIAILPGTALANNMFILDGINSAFNLERIYDNAALAFMDFFKSATAAGTSYGMLTLASG